MVFDSFFLSFFVYFLGPLRRFILSHLLLPWTELQWGLPASASSLPGLCNSVFDCLRGQPFPMVPFSCGILDPVILAKLAYSCLFLSLRGLILTFP